MRSSATLAFVNVSCPVSSKPSGKERPLMLKQFETFALMGALLATPALAFAHEGHDHTTAAPAATASSAPPAAAATKTSKTSKPTSKTLQKEKTTKKSAKRSGRRIPATK